MPELTSNQTNKCEGTIGELVNVLKSTENDKSQGNKWLIWEFYMTFKNIKNRKLQKCFEIYRK